MAAVKYGWVTVRATQGALGAGSECWAKTASGNVARVRLEKAASSGARWHGLNRDTGRDVQVTKVWHAPAAGAAIIGRTATGETFPAHHQVVDGAPSRTVPRLTVVLDEPLTYAGQVWPAGKALRVLPERVTLA